MIITNMYVQRLNILGPRQCNTALMLTVSTVKCQNAIEKCLRLQGIFKTICNSLDFCILDNTTSMYTILVA